MKSPVCEFLCAVLILIACCPESQGNEAIQSYSARREQAIHNGLTYLAKRQNKDGSYGTDKEMFGRDPAISALCGLAFLAAGSTPGRGEFGEEINRSLRYILDCAVTKRLPGHTEYAGTPNTHNVYGLITGPNQRGNKPMYGHGYATLFLAECYGMSFDSGLKEKLVAAVDLIVSIQNAEGGWRYEPYAVAVADISVTTCQVVALAAARDAGIYVPENTMKEALVFIEKCQNANGGFRYMQVGGTSGFGRTAAALFAMRLAGVSEGIKLERGTEYLASSVENWMNNPEWAQNSIEYFHYAQFYAASALWSDHKLNKKETLWLQWFSFILPKLMDSQSSDGSWPSTTSPEASTAMILCALAIDRERLPVFIR